MALKLKLKLKLMLCQARNFDGINERDSGTCLGDDQLLQDMWNLVSTSFFLFVQELETLLLQQWWLVLLASLEKRLILLLFVDHLWLLIVHLYM